MPRTVETGWEKTERLIDRGPITALMVVGFFGLLIAVAAFVFNPFGQAARIVNKTIDADNVIYNYEWFKLRHEGIIAIDSKIDAAVAEVEAFEESAGDRSEWDREDKIEHSRLRSIATGLGMQRDDLAGEYNAKSRMVNRSIFKAGDTELPERI